MGVNQKPDGQVKVGLGYSDLNEYKGYAGRREIVIQLTSDGATQDSLDALEFLKSYALYHNSVGEPIFPASTNVFISNNGVTKAVEADEVTVDGDNVNIGGCVWNGENWDFTNAGQGGGSSLPAVTSSDNGKVLGVVDGAWAASEQGKKFIVTLTPYDETFSGGVMDKTVGEIKQAVDAGMEVWFQVTLNENLTGLYVCNGIDHYPNASFEYVFVAMAVLKFGNYFLVRITTSAASEDETGWFGTIFPLTPAS